MFKAPKLLPLLLLAAACAPKSDDGDSASNPIVSNGGQTYTQFIATVRLSTPPLLATAQLVNGKPVVDPGAKQKLLAEQQKFLDGLKALPGQIKVLYTYRLTLNGFSLLVPIELKDKFTRMAGVISMEEQAVFERPDPQGSPADSTGTDLTKDNSVNFIEGGAAHAMGLTGQGLRVGVIDTGVDYTHKMFGGAGTPDAYTANDPAKVEEGSFPTGKVVGGIDLVGTAYNAASIDEKLRVPTPDADPLDEAGHGSHVAGTIAGHGDGTNTYDGVAPDAQIYAIKIFGKTGSTGDGPILAAFEYAADPNQDLDPSDRLDAVNLSLGANYGTRFAEYEEAIKNLASAGTVTLCAAGNAGATPYIVSSPGTAEHAISVAAAIDNSPWNWRFDAAEFSYPENASDLQQIVDAAFTKPSRDAVGVTGKLAYIGTAATDLTDEQKAAVKGNVALIDRGAVAFVDKVRRANDAGAIGVVVANNQPGAPIVMGGDGKTTFTIPAFMVTLDFGTTIKADLAAGKDVTVNFATGKTVDHPELIDQLTDFSSRGPRSIDGLIKPEVTGPGYQVISAKMGSGAEGVKFSGTSMATPHLTGAIALLRQAHPDASVAELKARVMNASAPIHDAKGAAGVAAQGAGRVQIVKAAQAPLFLDPPSLSLGVMAASAPVSTARTVTIANTSDADVHATVTFAPKAGLSITGPSTIDVPAHGTKKVSFGFNVDLSQAPDVVTELDNLIHVTAGDSVLSLPVLAEGRKGSTIKLASFSRSSNGPIDMAFSNGGPQQGDVMAFNLLGQEKASAASTFGACALSSAGYRIVQRTDPATGTTTNLLEFAVRLVTPLSTWNACEVSVLFDANGDGVPEQELAGAGEAGLWATPPTGDPFASFLVDAPHMRDIEAKTEQGQPADKPSAAVLDQQPFTRFAFSPVGVVAADLSKVAKTPNGMLRFQIGTLPFYTGGVRDDFLANATWYVVDPNNAPFRGMTENLRIANGASAQLETQSFVPGSSLLLYFPQNDPSVSTQLIVPAQGRPR